MPRITIDVDDKFNDTLAELAQGSNKADVLRRAVASYQYLRSELGSADSGRHLSITDASGQVQKDVLLPGSTADPASTPAATLAAGDAELQPHSMQAHALRPQTVTVSSADVGSVEIAPPTFLERWGVVFLACFGGWIIVTGTILLVYFLWKQPPSPNLTGLNAEGLRDAISAHKQILDQWRDSLNYIFDLLITKTALPLVTLLLGYLFGKGKSDTP